MFLDIKRTPRSGRPGPALKPPGGAAPGGPRTGPCRHLSAAADPINLIGCSCFSRKKLQELKHWES